MKRASLLFAATLLIGMLFSTQVIGQARINLNGVRSAQECLNATNEGFTATFSFSSIDAAEVATERGVFSNIAMDGTYPAGNIGDPTLPAANKLVAVPIGANNVSVEVKSYSTAVYNLADYGIHSLYPQQIPLRKDQNPEDVPFSYNAKAYTTPGFVERPIALFEIQGTMRGIQVGALTINPVQYDAVNNLVRVYNNIEVEVNFGEYDQTAAFDEFARTFNPYFVGIYKTMCNNRQLRDVYDEHPDMWQNPVKMLVITNRAFENTIQDWVTWKTEKGFYVDVNYTDVIGSNASAIRTFIQQKYNEDAPTFLMILGDKNMVPESANGSETNCVTDLQYSSVDNDMFSDMFHSRFPAENEAQMTSMINKALEYEQLTMPDPSYLGNVLLIAGSDSGWGQTVGRPAIKYASYYYYNTEHGFNNVYEYSDNVYTGCYSHLNTGVGFANYTAHGSNTSWSGPSLTNSDVNNLTNEHKYFLAMGNCCQAADWGISGACFGETMVRAENKAAYAYIGSCPSTYWLNDYYFAVGATSQANGTMPDISITTMGCYDAIWDNEAWNTVDAIRFVGNLASNAAEALGYQIHISNLYDWQAYHTLGDGSILPYRVEPTEQTVSHLPTLPIGMDFYTVTAEPGSYVGISKDGVLYGAGMIDESGTTDIAITPITSGGDAKIVVTHPQHVPYIATVPAAAMTGAYVALDTYNMINAEQANYGETIDMNISVKNVGADASGDITATLTSECEYVEILAGEGSLSGLAPEETGTMEGFQFSVAENVPDKTKAQFDLTVTDGTDVWEAHFNITLHAPVLTLESVAQNEEHSGVGALTFVFKNTGSAPFYGGTLEINSCSPDLTFEPSIITTDETVNGDETIELLSNYTVAEGVAPASSFEVNYVFTTGEFEINDIFVLTYEVIIHNFESGFGEGWSFSPTNNAWIIVDGGVKGEKCAQSANNGINNSDYSMTLTVDVFAAGDMTFMFKVSSESTYDKFFFYMDNQSMISGGYSGEVAWTQYTQPVTVGQHTFKWEYHKDSSVSSGSDCVQVDEITFPIVNSFAFIAPATDLVADVEGSEVTLTWTASEDATQYVVARDGENLATVSETSYIDQLPKDGTYTYTVYAVNSNGQLSTPISATVVAEFDAVGEGQEARINVYPNPANNVLNIVANGNFEYRLFNSTGQEVAAGTAQGVKQINVSDFSKGVYFLHVTTGAQVDIQKVVVE